jgi:hypothetical protein
MIILGGPARQKAGDRGSAAYRDDAHAGNGDLPNPDITVSKGSANVPVSGAMTRPAPHARVQLVPALLSSHHSLQYPTNAACARLLWSAHEVAQRCRD